VFPKRIILTLWIAAVMLPAQSPYNSAGMGLLSDFSDAPAFGLGTSGLIGSYSHAVSTQNPSTWPELKFSKLSVHYRGGGDSKPEP